MIGHIAYFYLRNTGRYEIINVVFRTLLTEDSVVVNVMDKQAVANVVRNTRPDIILNCVGVLIKGAQKHPDDAIYINAYFPHQLANLANEVGAKFIHISTDCVFSGRKGNYTETDFRDADDVYGRSKALGEVINQTDLTLRTSIIGPELKKNGEGLFHWFMHQNHSINGFKTAIWSGVTTLELTKVIDFAIQHNLIGLIHVSNGIGISKMDLLNLFKSIWHKNIDIVPIDANGIDKSIVRSARLDYNVPSYQDMFEEQKKWMDEHRELYKQYR